MKEIVYLAPLALLGIGAKASANQVTTHISNALRIYEQESKQNQLVGQTDDEQAKPSLPNGQNQPVGKEEEATHISRLDDGLINEDSSVGSGHASQVMKISKSAIPIKQELNESKESVAGQYVQVQQNRVAQFNNGSKIYGLNNSSQLSKSNGDGYVITNAGTYNGRAVDIGVTVNNVKSSDETYTTKWSNGDVSNVKGAVGASFKYGNSVLTSVANSQVNLPKQTRERTETKDVNVKMPGYAWAVIESNSVASSSLNGPSYWINWFDPKLFYDVKTHYNFNDRETLLVLLKSAFYLHRSSDDTSSSFIIDKLVPHYFKADGTWYADSSDSSVDHVSQKYVDKNPNRYISSGYTITESHRSGPSLNDAVFGTDVSLDYAKLSDRMMPTVYNIGAEADVITGVINYEADDFNKKINSISRADALESGIGGNYGGNIGIGGALKYDYFYNGSPNNSQSGNSDPTYDHSFIQEGGSDSITINDRDYAKRFKASTGQSMTERQDVKVKDTLQLDQVNNGSLNYDYTVGVYDAQTGELIKDLTAKYKGKIGKAATDQDTVMNDAIKAKIQAINADTANSAYTGITANDDVAFSKNTVHVNYIDEHGQPIDVPGYDIDVDNLTSGNYQVPQNYALVNTNGFKVTKNTHEVNGVTVTDSYNFIDQGNNKVTDNGRTLSVVLKHGTRHIIDPGQTGLSNDATNNVFVINNGAKRQINSQSRHFGATGVLDLVTNKITRQGDWKLFGKSNFDQTNINNDLVGYGNAIHSKLTFLAL